MMAEPTNPIHSKLRVASGFIIVGLLVQAISLFWNHPLSFIAFVTVGGLLLAIGIVLYLVTLVNIPSPKPDREDSMRQHISNKV